MSRLVVVLLALAGCQDSVESQCRKIYDRSMTMIMGRNQRYLPAEEKRDLWKNSMEQCKAYSEERRTCMLEALNVDALVRCESK